MGMELEISKLWKTPKENDLISSINKWEGKNVGWDTGKFQLKGI